MGHVIVLGVSGGIAACKSPELVRLLVKEGYDVHCIMTENALRFITPLTLATLSENPVLHGNFESSESGKMAHIQLSETAALFLVAPATANVIAKMAWGLADDLLSTTLLASQGLVAICPAMNVYMWEHSATQENLRTLRDRGITLIGPAEGELACGYEGMGRMEEPSAIVDEVRELLDLKSTLKGKKVLITAGPTREFIDPVRFLSNPSSGRMGYAMAQVARQFGGDVILISGPTEIAPPFGVKCVRVTTAEEMLNAVVQHFNDCHVFISVAAVSDWRPIHFKSEKEKKSNTHSVIEMEPTVDVLAHVSKQKKSQVLVGFAAETNNLEANAIQKLEKKNLDLVVGNLVSRNGRSAFGSSDTEMTLFFRNGKSKLIPRTSKFHGARIVVEAVAQLLT